ncbi:hypothetical protein PPYR_04765 [Photinus pyralis]|uniref:Uncharacterized protein n=1 Tax=Photinus pyralis TaxID=7054 RepID=A0A5N4AZ09_PHOPY|nr:hypothetical protein PPYR_04765 [Photinus pyralis]
MTKRRRHQNKLSKVEGAIEKLQKITEGRTCTLTKVLSDDSEGFGKYIPAQLKDLPMVNRLILQETIQAMRLKLLQTLRTALSPLLSRTLSHGGYSGNDYTLEEEVTADGSLIYLNLKECNTVIIGHPESRPMNIF